MDNVKRIKVEFSVFQPAIDAMFSGNAVVLKQLLADDHGLISFRLDEPTDGYFAHPYLLWFIAANPVCSGRFPANICEIASLIIDAIRQNAPETLQYQVTYALELLAAGSNPGEPGLVIALIDLLIDSGAESASRLFPQADNSQRELALALAVFFPPCNV